MILIQNILNGNPQAQEKLYNKYKKIIKNFLKAKYSQSDIDDVSEIMIKIFINLKSFDNTKSKFSSWVFSITKNYMIDKWRSNATLNAENINYITTNDCISTSNTSSYITSTNINNLEFITNSSMEFENNSSINYISKQLSAEEFTLLDMKYVQGFDYNEIGKKFNVSSSTISNRVNYIKTKLKKNNPEIIYD